MWHTTGLTITRKKQRGGVVDTRQVLQRDACLVHGSRVVVETETHSSGSGSSFGSGSGSANPVIVGNFPQEIRVGLADQPGQLQEELSNGQFAATRICRWCLDGLGLFHGPAAPKSKD